MTSSPRLTRRTLLYSTAALSLAACAPQGNGDTKSESPSPGEVPQYIPFSGIKPDLPGTADGVAPGFFNYPQPPLERQGYPLEDGRSFTALMQALPPSTPPDQNQNYRQMMDRLGVGFEVLYGSYTEYRNKFQVTMASGDLPDLVMIIDVPQLPQLLAKNFTDLTDILGGDGIKNYPGLANIPTPTWSISSINGRIWGVAQPRPPAGRVITARGDLMQDFGISDPNVELADGAEFTELLTLLSSKPDRYALGADPVGWLLPIVKTMIGVPNEWKVESGRFIHENETDEIKEALIRAQDLIKVGVMHPNSFMSPAQNRPWFTSGVTSLYAQAFVGWGGDARNFPEWDVGNVRLPMWEGGGPAPVHKSPAGYDSWVAIKKTADESRVEQLLKVIDYIASPFGTQQYLDILYGVPGYSYNLDPSGNPVRIPDAPEIPNLTYAGGNSSAVLYGQGDEQIVRAQHSYLSEIMPSGLENPADGLYSETKVGKAASLAARTTSIQREILQGLRPLSAWDDFVKKWKSEVGDKMAAELEEAANA